MPVLRITANGTTPAPAGYHKLNWVIINTRGASANLLTLRNGAADGTIMGVIDTTVGPVGIPYGGVLFSQGLTAVSATGTAADVTIVYDEPN